MRSWYSISAAVVPFPDRKYTTLAPKMLPTAPHCTWQEAAVNDHSLLWRQTSGSISALTVHLKEIFLTACGVSWPSSPRPTRLWDTGRGACSSLHSWRSRVGDPTKTWGFTRRQCTHTHKEHQTLSGLRACAYSLNCEREAHPNFCCAVNMSHHLQ